MTNSTIATVENTASKSTKPRKAAAKVENAIATASAPVKDVDYQAETVEATPDVITLENAIAQANLLIDMIQGDINKSLGFEWKRSAHSAIKAIAAKQVEAYSLRDALGNEGIELEANLQAIEAIALESGDLLVQAQASKPSESELSAYIVLHGKGALLIDGEEYLIESEAIAIVRYVRQTKEGQLSVLFIAPTQGNKLEPIGILTPDTVKRFADIRLTSDIQKAIATAKSKWCEGFKQAGKLDKLTQKEQAVNARFKSAGFSRI